MLAEQARTHRRRGHGIEVTYLAGRISPVEPCLCCAQHLPLLLRAWLHPGRRPRERRQAACARRAAARAARAAPAVPGEPRRHRGAGIVRRRPAGRREEVRGVTQRSEVWRVTATYPSHVFMSTPDRLLGCKFWRATGSLRGCAAAAGAGAGSPFARRGHVAVEQARCVGRQHPKLHRQSDGAQRDQQPGPARPRLPRPGRQVPVDGVEWGRAGGASARTSRARLSCPRTAGKGQAPRWPQPGAHQART
jgi:hypothetical protein